jgi:hypothetical protein
MGVPPPAGVEETVVPMGPLEVLFGGKACLTAPKNFLDELDGSRH